jgi:hypothetical protein
MNKTQHDAAIRSFAAELHRLGHAMPLPADDEERAHDELLAIGLICNIISHLCPTVLGRWPVSLLRCATRRTMNPTTTPHRAGTNGSALHQSHPHPRAFKDAARQAYSRLGGGSGDPQNGCAVPRRHPA